jgi:hypothetical protein
MVVGLILVLALSTPILPHSEELSPGDALGLSTQGVVSSPVTLPKAPSRAVPPAVPLGTAGGLTVASLALTLARRRREEGPLYVLVHGHGGSETDFDGLMRAMGVSPERTVAFDYRTVRRASSSTAASRAASTKDAAEKLDDLIRRLARDHGTVYSIHHSKGGAVGVEMIAAIDAGRRPTIDGYIGAALLDPAIGSGDLGRLQRFGGWFGPIPDNGGFNPKRCDATGCRDIRANLGSAAGIEVIAIRNPDAMVTNFLDDPPGLRTYDLVDDGKPIAVAKWWNPPGILRRVFEAHGSVLSHWTVAECISAEVAAPASCSWKGHRRMPRIWWGRGVGARSSALRI